MNSITINAPRSFFSWFAPTPVWVLGQAVVPLLMAVVAKNVRGLWARLAALRKAGPGA